MDKRLRTVLGCAILTAMIAGCSTLRQRCFRVDARAVASERFGGNGEEWTSARVIAVLKAFAADHEFEHKPTGPTAEPTMLFERSTAGESLRLTLSLRWIDEKREMPDKWDRLAAPKSIDMSVLEELLICVEGSGEPSELVPTLATALELALREAFGEANVRVSAGAPSD